MANSNVFSLIKKFEQLTTAMGKPANLPEKPRKVAEVSESQREFEASTSSQSVPIKPETNTWTNNSITDIEMRVHSLKEEVQHFTTLEENEKALLGFFSVMLELLINLSTIDTDGLKSLKQRKDACLAELKILKATLTNFILPAPVENYEDTINITPEENKDDEKPDSLNSPDLPPEFVRRPSVMSLAQQFESQSTYSIPRMDDRPGSSNFLSCDDSFDKNKQEIKEDIEYYASIINNIYPDDYAGINAIKQYLWGLKNLPGLNLEADQEIDVLLYKITALECGPNMEEALMQEATNKVLEDIESGNVPLQPEEELPVVEDSIEVIGIDIPGEEAQVIIDHDLVPSLNALTKFHELKSKCLNPTIDITQLEEEIQEHYIFLNQFSPHPTLRNKFNQLSIFFKQMLDRITDINFDRIYEQPASDMDQNEGNFPPYPVPVFQNPFCRLVTETANYHELIDTLDPADTVRAKVIAEDLAEIIAEIKECDMAAESDFKAKQSAVLQELAGLQLKLAEKCNSIE